MQNRDYGNLVFLKAIGTGVIYLRVLPTPLRAVQSKLIRISQTYSKVELAGAFVIKDMIQSTNFDLRRLLILAGLLSTAILPTSGAIAATKIVHSSNVSAALSYQKADTEFPKFSHLRLKIARGGQILLDRPLPESEGAWPLVALETEWTKENKTATFQVRTLDTDQEPEVLLDLFTGGAHCCTYSLIYRYDSAAKRYSYIKHDWGNTGYKLQDLSKDNIPEFDSRDDRFAYAFGSYAGSAFPLQIWQYRQGRMLEVTRQYPKLIYEDAYYWWQLFVQKGQQDTVEYGRGPLSAYLADKYLLGEGQDGWQRIEQVYKGGDRQQYFGELRSFLQKTGYIQRDLKTGQSAR